MDNNKLIEALSIIKEGKSSKYFRIGHDSYARMSDGVYKTECILCFTDEKYKEEFKYCIDKKFIHIYSLLMDSNVHLTKEGEIELRDLLIESI